MKALTGKGNKDEGLLTTVAQSIGSTMGTIVGRANAAQKVLSQAPRVPSMKREGKKFSRKGNKAGRRAKSQR